VKVIKYYLLIFFSFCAVAFSGEREFVFRGGIKFGMSPEEVKKLEATVGVSNFVIELEDEERLRNYITYKTPLLDEEFTLDYYFTEHKLYEIAYRISYSNI